MRPGTFRRSNARITHKGLHSIFAEVAQQPVDHARRIFGGRRMDYAGYFARHPDRYGPGSTWVDPEDPDAEIEIEGLAE